MIFCQDNIIMLCYGCNPILDDGLMTSTFNGYLYVLRLYVYFGVWMCECLSIFLYSYSSRKSSAEISCFNERG